MHSSLNYKKRELKSGLVIEPEKNIQLTWHAMKLKIKIITLHNVCAVYWGRCSVHWWDIIENTGGDIIEYTGGVSIQIQLFSQ